MNPDSSISQIALNPALDLRLQTHFQGCQDAEEVEVEGMKRVPPTDPQPQASSHPLLNKEGSTLCDWFLELFSERIVSTTKYRRTFL